MATASSPSQAFRPQRTLITGGAGFIIGDDDVIVVADCLDRCASRRNLDSLSNITLAQVNVTDWQAMKALFQRHSFDTVVHFAASTHVDDAFDHPVQFTANNVLGTHVLLECCRRFGIRRFIHISTDEVYGEVECTESDPMRPSNPYSGTKAAAECLVQSYIRAFRFPAIIVRCSNVYGPRQYPEKIIPKFICRLLSGRTCFIHGDGLHQRRYIYVDDVMDALEIVLKSGSIGEAYNVGASREFTTLDVARALIRRIADSSLSIDGDKYLEFVSDRTYNDRRYALNCKKLMALGWQPRVNFDTGIDQTIAWYRQNDHRTYWSDTACVDCEHNVPATEPDVMN